VVTFREGSCATHQPSAKFRVSHALIKVKEPLPLFRISKRPQHLHRALFSVLCTSVSVVHCSQAAKPIMPPRKSNISITTNGGEDGAETTTTKASKDVLSVDVSAPSYVARTKAELCIGTQPSEVDDCPPCQRGSSGQYSDTQGCIAGFAQERHSLRQLHRINVSLVAGRSQCFYVALS
jgi:hypothetical protein